MKTPTVALALILFGSIFQAFASDTVNDRAPHEFLDLCSVNSSLFAERIFQQSGSYSLTRLVSWATQVSRRDTVDCLEHKHGDFEDDSLVDW